MPLSMKELLGERNILSIDELLGQPQRVYSLDELLGTTLPYSYEEKRLREERDTTIWQDVLGIIEQFGRGAVEEASLGLAKNLLWEDKPPETTPEQIASGLGRLGGFFTTPLAIGKVGGKLAVKAVPWALKGLKGKKAARATRLGSFAVRGATALGVAEAVSDIADIENMPQRFLHGAKIGTIFGAAGMLNITKYPILNQILMQGGGRAMLKIAGEYPPGTFSKENLPQAVFSEALYTFFLRKGITYEEIASGKIKPKARDLIRQIDRESEAFNRTQAELEKVEFPESFFRKKRTKLSPAEIAYDATALNPESIGLFKKGLKGGFVGKGREATDYIPNLYWDEALGKYKTLRHANVVEAKRLLNIEQTVRGEEFDPTMDVRIIDRRPGKQRGRLPKTLEALTPFQTTTVDAGVIEKIMMTESYVYNTKSKQIRPEARGEAKIKGIKPYEIRFERIENTWIPTRFGWGAKKTTAAELPNIQKKVVDRLTAMREIPLTKLPPDAKDMLDLRARELGIGLTNAKPLYDYMGLKSNEVVLGRLVDIEQTFHDMEVMPRHKRYSRMFQSIKMKHDLMDKAIIDPRLKKKQATDDAYLDWKQKRAFAKAMITSKLPGKDPSVLVQLSNIPTLKRWWDVRLAFQWLQENWDIPLYKIHKRISRGASTRNRALTELTAPLSKFNNLLEAEQIMIRKYYAERHAGLDPARTKANFPEHLQRYIDAIDTLMGKAAPYISKYRYRLWYDNVVSKDPLSKTPEMQVYKNQKALTPQLRQMVLPYQHYVLEGRNPELFYTLLNEKLPRLGLIEEGVYLPEMIVEPTLRGLRAEHLVQYMDISKGHTRPRGEIRTKVFGKEKMIDIEKSVIDTVRNQDLNSQIMSYLNQVLNLEYVERHMKALEDVVTPIAGFLDRAKLKAVGKAVPEAKGASTLDLIKTYALRQKNYPLKLGGFGTALRTIQSWFFRALVVKPFLILRNLHQWVVTHPFKKMVLDPRFIFTRWRNLDTDVKENFTDRGINQFTSMLRDWQFLEATEGIKKMPVFGKYVEFAERIGKMYPASDLFNRRRVFTTAFNRSTHYINEFLAEKIGEDKLHHELGLSKMRHYERRSIAEFISERNVKEAAFEVAEWHTANSQWIYRRAEKSLYEMTAEGETYTNLMTWTKGVTQQLLGAFQKIHEWGWERPGLTKKGRLSKEAIPMYREALGGMGQIAGLLLAGQVANQLLAHVGTKHASKYQSYGLDMFVWEWGGVTVEILKTFTDTIGELATATDGTPEERRRAIGNALKNFDNLALRQMLPFAKQALAVIESITGRSYISPIYDKYSEWINGYPVMAKVVKRNALEGMMHGLLATDPNKSTEVRNFTYRKMLEFGTRYTRSTGAMKTYYGLMLKRYRYLNDLFNRYEPHLVMKHRQQKEYQAWLRGK